MSDLHPTAARGFGQGAGTYARGRPDFPPEALQWLRRDLGVGPGTIALELGAGTGKFTKLLTKTGADVVAVEPVAAMLAQLAAEQPDVRAISARARSLPLASSSVDVVICAQSFHWFATREALGEIRRVLKPGGALGLIWNVRDRSAPWVVELSRLIDRHEDEAPRYDDGEWREVFPAPGFGPMHEKSVPHAHVGSAGRVIVDRTASISFIAALPQADRATLLDEVREFIARTPELAGRADVAMPYVTKMFWCLAD